MRSFGTFPSRRYELVLLTAHGIAKCTTGTWLRATTDCVAPHQLASSNSSAGSSLSSLIGSIKCAASQLAAGRRQSRQSHCFACLAVSGGRPCPHMSTISRQSMSVFIAVGRLKSTAARDAKSHPRSLVGPQCSGRVVPKCLRQAGVTLCGAEGRAAYGVPGSGPDAFFRATRLLPPLSLRASSGHRSNGSRAAALRQPSALSLRTPAVAGPRGSPRSLTRSRAVWAAKATRAEHLSEVRVRPEPSRRRPPHKV